MVRGGHGGIYAFDVIQIYDMLSVLNAIFSAPPLLKEDQITNSGGWSISAGTWQSPTTRTSSAEESCSWLVDRYCGCECQWTTRWVECNIIRRRLTWTSSTLWCNNKYAFHLMLVWMAADVLVDMQINGADQECLPVSLFCLSRQLWSREICTA